MTNNDLFGTSQFESVQDILPMDDLPSFMDVKLDDLECSKSINTVKPPHNSTSSNPELPLKQTPDLSSNLDWNLMNLNAQKQLLNLQLSAMMLQNIQNASQGLPMQHIGTNFDNKLDFLAFQPVPTNANLWNPNYSSASSTIVDKNNASIMQTNNSTLLNEFSRQMAVRQPNLLNLSYGPMPSPQNGSQLPTHRQSPDSSHLLEPQLSLIEGSFPSPPEVPTLQADSPHSKKSRKRLTKDDVMAFNKLGLTQKDTAKECGVSLSTLKRFIRTNHIAWDKFAGYRKRTRKLPAGGRDPEKRMKH